MFNRSPPLTRQRQRNLFLQQQQENRVQQNNSRPHNTANTENVHENSVVDGELLESLHHAMNSIEIENALLNVDPPNRQNVPLAGMGNNVNAENNRDDGEKMDISEAKISWTATCESGEHILCKKLLVGDIDPVLTKTDGIGAMRIHTPLQGLITLFILRSNVPMSASKELLKGILNADPDFELIKFVEERGDALRSGSCPCADEAETIWRHWAVNCSIVHQTLKKSAFDPIELEAPIALSEMPEADRIVWKKLFDGGSWALEKVRAVVVHGKTTLVDQPRVIIGDSSGAQLCGDAKNQIAAHFIGTVNGALGDVIRTLDRSVFTSKVSSALIFLGRDALTRGENVAQIVGECARIRELCARFKHVQFIWIPPPFVREQHVQYNELLPELEKVAGEWFVAFTSSGRSLVEIWRFGDTFDMTRVRADGKILPEGLKCLRAWIFTQIPRFPDDNSLGIHRLSRSVPSVSSHLSELSIDHSHNSRERRAHHPYAVRQSFYRGRGRRDGNALETRRRH